MSLKAFHVLFISLSVVLAVAFGCWALDAYATAHTSGHLAAAIGAFLISATLVAYEVAFLRKCRRLEI